MNNIYRKFGTIITLSALLFFIYYLINNIELLKSVNFSANTLLGISICIFEYTIVMLLSAITWNLLLKSLDIELSHSKSIYIYFVSQIGKYIPGNIGHHIGRVTISRNYGLPTGKVVFSMTLEIVLIIFSALFISLIGWLLFDSISKASETVSIPIWNIVVVCLFLLTIPYALKISLEWIVNKKQCNEDQPYVLPTPRISIILAALLLYTIAFSINGLILWTLSGIILQDFETNLLLYISIFAISWTVGFITPGAPAGLGVREATLIILFGMIFDNDNALGLAILLRIVTTLGDGAIFIVGHVIKQSYRLEPIK